jgi:hypothetical protein
MTVKFRLSEKVNDLCDGRHTGTAQPEGNDHDSMTMTQ